MKNKLFFSIFFLIISFCFSQTRNKNIKVIDIAEKQIKLLKKNGGDKIILSTIYTPYKELWSGYLGNENDFIKWLNEKGNKKISTLKTNQKVNPKYLSKELKQLSRKMHQFTGFKPNGNWYIIYGPAWTNLGGLSTGEMILDLSHNQNSTNEKIIKLYPHELNHQIYFYTKPKSEKIALDRILDEGFATYVSYLFHNQKHTIAEELGYSEKEYQYCVDNEKILIGLLKKYYLDENESVSRNLADRNYKVGQEFPGAIAYYLGFKIVENYISLNGKDSWKDIYKMNPLEVLEKSKILE